MSSVDSVVEAEVRAAQLKQALHDSRLREHYQQGACGGGGTGRIEFAPLPVPEVYPAVTLEGLAAVITACGMSMHCLNGSGTERTNAESDLAAIIAKAREVVCGKADGGQMTPDALEESYKRGKWDGLKAASAIITQNPTSLAVCARMLMDEAKRVRGDG